MDKRIVKIIFLVLIILLASYLYKDRTATVDHAQWLDEYKEQVPESDYNRYTQKTLLYNYDSPVVQEIVELIKQRSSTPEEAAEHAAETVYELVDYKFEESDEQCYVKTGSMVITSGSGQCDTQSRAVVTILRGLGLMARTDAGCLNIPDNCAPAFAIFPQDTFPYLQPYRDGDMGRYYAGLHTWAEVYLPGKGWTKIESTRGRMVPANSCLVYIHELYPENNIDECITQNITFARMCGKL